MADCPNLVNCGFFKKHCDDKSLACKGFMAMFCKGEKQTQCERKKFKAEHGCPPSDDMMPNGQMLATC